MSSDRKQWVEALAEEHGRMVFATAYRVLGRPEDAEDVLQEVFLKLLGESVRPEDIRDWGPYLRVMTTRRAIDVLRRGARRPETTGLPLDEVADGDGRNNPRETADRRQKAEMLREALARLPARDAAVFALRTFEEYSYERIAAQLGLKASQMGVILHRARRRLAELLGVARRRPARRKKNEVTNDARP